MGITYHPGAVEVKSFLYPNHRNSARLKRGQRGETSRLILSWMGWVLCAVQRCAYIAQAQTHSCLTTRCQNTGRFAKGKALHSIRPRSRIEVLLPIRRAGHTAKQRVAGVTGVDDLIHGFLGGDQVVAVGFLLEDDGLVVQAPGQVVKYL